MTFRVGPASIIATSSLGDAAALGDELGLARMDEADRVELGLGDGAGDEARGGAGAGQADGEFERVERVAGAFEVGPPGHDLGVGLDPQDRQRRRRTRRPPRGDRRSIAIGPSQTALTAETLPTAKKGGTLVPAAPLPAFRDDLRPDPRRIAQRDGERDCPPAQR